MLHETHAYNLQALTPNRWDFCFTYIDQSVSWIASKFFIDEAYTDEQREVTKTMADELKEGFIGRIESRDWITDSTKALIEEKAEEMLIGIGTNEIVSTPQILLFPGFVDHFLNID